MPQNRNFRKTILPGTLPKLHSRTDGAFISHEEIPSDGPAPKPDAEMIASPKTQEFLRPPLNANAMQTREGKWPKITKLPVERIDDDKSNVLIIDGRRYDKIQVVDQAGRGILGMEDSDSFPMVLIKERQRDRKLIGSLKASTHSSIVGLRAIFYHVNSVSMIYEYELGAMTLASVASCPSVEFSDADIATVSHDVLCALQFIHSELKIAHGNVKDGNIILTYSGGLKLANIGDSMLNEMTLKHRDRDLEAVGTVAMNICDRSTKLMKPEVAHWSTGASLMLKQFILKTTEEPLARLLQHEFLSLAAPTWSLKPHLIKALNFDPTFLKVILEDN